LGKPVELVSADHQNKPDLGTAIARRWYDGDGVDMITDVPGSPVGFAVQTMSLQYKKLAHMGICGSRCSIQDAMVNLRSSLLRIQGLSPFA
jgi:branched-chain amino acid transport system substrate-binding protein